LAAHIIHEVVTCHPFFTAVFCSSPFQFEKEVYDIVGSSWRLRDSEQVIAISRIMLQAETPSQRIMLLQVLQVGPRSIPGYRPQTVPIGFFLFFISVH